MFPILQQPARHEAPLAFDNLQPLAPGVPTTRLVIGGVVVDLHDAMRFAGIAYGPEDQSLTLGFVADEAHDGGSGADGVTLVVEGLSRLEMSFQEAQPGALEYIELRHDPEESLLFFFEGGTIRASGTALRAALLADQPPLALPLQ